MRLTALRQHERWVQKSRTSRTPGTDTRADARFVHDRYQTNALTMMPAPMTFAAAVIIVNAAVARRQFKTTILLTAGRYSWT